MNDNIKSLWNTLRNCGYNPPAIDQFAKDMQDEENLKGVHATLQKEGYTPPELNTFKKDMGWHKMLIGGKETYFNDASYNDFMKRHPNGRSGTGSGTAQPKSAGNGGTVAKGTEVNTSGTVGASSPKRMQMPQGFGAFNPDAGMPSYLQEGQKKQREEGYGSKEEQQRINDVDAALKGDKGAMQRAGLDRMSQQMKDRADYYAATGKELKDDVLDMTQFGVAPTVERDENGNVVTNENGEVVRGMVNDDVRANTQTRDSHRIEEEIEAERLEEQDKALKKEQVSELGNYIDNMIAKLKSQHVRTTPFQMRSKDGWLDPFRETDADRQAQYEIQHLEAAKRSLRDAQRIINEADHNAQSGTLGAWLESSFAGGAARGFGQKFFDVDTWLMGTTDLSDNSYTKLAMQKADKGMPLTEAEQALLDAKAVEMATNAYFGSYVGHGYNAGQVYAEAIPFIIEMCINPASATGETAGAMLTRYALKRFGKQALKNNAKKFAAAKAATRMAGDVAGSAIMTGTTGLMRTTADAVARESGEVQFKDDEKGRTLYAGHSHGEDPIKAFGKAYAGTTIENFSEMVGEYFAPVFGIAGDIIGKITPKSVREFVQNVASSDIGKLIGDFEKHAKWNGVFSEYAEEVAGNMMNALVVGDMTLDTAEGTGVFNLDQNIETFLGVSLMGGVISGAKTIGYRTPKYRAKKAMNKSADIAERVFNGNEAWATIRDVITNGSDEDIKQTIADVLVDDSYTEDQKRAVLDYAKDVETYNGMIRGEQERRIEDAGSTQVDLETSFDNGYTLESPQAMNDAKNTYEYQQSQLQELFGDETGAVQAQLDRDPVGTLGRMTDIYTEEQKQTALDYVNAKATYEGMIDRVRDDIEAQIEASDRRVDERVNQATGMIHPVTLAIDGRQVYIVDGYIVMTGDGGIVDAELSSESFVYRDAETGKLDWCGPRDILTVDDAINAEEEKEQARQLIRDTVAQTEADKIDGVLAFGINETYPIVDEQGQAHQVTILADNGDGTVMVAFDGQASNDPVAKDTIQQMADNANMARLQAQLSEKALTDGEASGTVAREYNQKDEVTLHFADGRTVRGQVSAEEDPDGMIEIYAEEPVDGSRFLRYSREELDALTAEPSANTEGTVAGEATESVETPVVDEMPMNGEEPDFMAVTPARAYLYIYEESGLEAEDADAFVQNNVVASQKALDKLQEKKPKMGTSIAKFNRDKAEWQEKVDVARAENEQWRQIKAERANVIAEINNERAEQERAAIEQAKAEEEAFRAEQEKKAQEQAEIGSNAVAPAISEKWQNAKKIEGAKDEIVLANGEKVAGRYMLVESGVATPSHDATNGFVKSEGFPVDENGGSVNDRDYEHDKDAQQVTRDIAANYDSRAVQTPVVVSQDGVVLSGNGRTMAGELAAMNGTDGAYIGYLKDHATKYGFTAEQVEGMEHPRVVFVPNDAMPYTAETFAKFNQQEMKGQNKTEQAVKLGKVVSDGAFNRIIKIINGFDTLGDFYADQKATAEAVTELQNDGVITQVQFAEMFDGEGISAVGKELLENMLIGKAFESNPNAVREISEFKSMRQSIITALAEISNNLALGEDYSLESELAQAIDLVYQARKQGSKLGEPVSWYARQQNLDFFGFNDTVADYNNKTMLMIADVINDSRSSRLKKYLQIYNNNAKDAASGQMDLFSGDVRGKEDIINDVKQLFNYGSEEQQQSATAEAVARRKAEGAEQDGAVSDGEQPVGSGLVGEYSLSDKRAGNGEQFIQNANGDIDLVDIPQEVFDAIGYTKAPLRLTLSMLQHVISSHNKETKIKDENDAIGFILDVMTNFDHVRLGNNGALIFTVENGRNKTGKRAISILLSSKSGDFYGIVSSGFEGVERLQKRPLLWDGSAIITPTTDAASANVSTLDAQLSGEQSGSASNQSKDLSEGKVTDNSGDTQENQQKNAGNAPKSATVLNLNGVEYAVSDVENFVQGHVQRIIDEGGFDAEIVGVKVIGSYMRGEQRPDSDLDVLVEYKGKAKEDALFDALAEEGLEINGVNVDINPITEGKSGTIEQFMKRNAGFSKIAEEEAESVGTPAKQEPKSALKKGDRVIYNGEEYVITQLNTDFGDTRYEIAKTADSKSAQVVEPEEVTAVTQAEAPGAPEQDKEATGEDGYSVSPAEYTTKRGKKLQMQLVKFGADLSKEQLNAAKALAKQLNGWWSKSDGGFMMRTVEDAEKLADAVLGDKEAVMDNQPVSLSDLKAVETLAPGAVERNTEAETKAEPQAETKRLVSDARMEELKARMRKKLYGQLNVGVDPELLAIGAELAVGHIERGVTKFAAFAKTMLDDIGDVVRPYLKAFYNAVRDMPEAADYADQMDSYDEVSKFDVANFGKTTTDAMATAEQIVNEQKVEKDVETATEQIQTERNEARKVAEAEEEPEFRAATEEDLDKREVVYYDGKPTHVMVVMHKGEQIGAGQMSKPVVDSVYLTNGKNVKLEDLQVRVEKPVKKSKKKTESKKKEVPLQGELDLFSQPNSAESADQSTNVEPENQENNGNREVRLQDGTVQTGRGGHQREQNAQVGGSTGSEAEGSDGQGVGRRDTTHPVSDGERGRGLSELPESQSGIEELGDTPPSKEPSVKKNTRNNHAERGKDYAPKGVDARIEANIKAIELMQKLILEGKEATPAQMKVLRQYSGWGGLGKAFDSGTYNPTARRLKELLGEDGYQQANMSRNSAYYTPATVIDAMWDIAKALGFKGGNVLEGSAGIGNIIGAMPTAMSERSNIQAVEIDETTGNILKLLYPDAQVMIQGFEKTTVPNGSVDLAITNVPFVTGLRVMDESGDKDLSKKFHDIHDFCIAKNVRKLREGGIGIFITSSGTLDNSQKLRNWIINEGGADVIGAFRLNNETFGGTGATSDIIVIRKRVNGVKSQNAIDVNTVSAERTATYTEEGKERTVSMDYNQYFMEHPENMGGKMMFGFEKNDTFRPTSKALYPVRGEKQADALAKWVEGFKGMKEEQPKSAVNASAAQQQDTVYESLGDDVKEGSMVVNGDGELCVAQMGAAVPLGLNANKVKGHTKVECFNAYQRIKKAVAAVLEYQTNNEDNAGLTPLLKELNKAYDDFVKTYGHLHKNVSISFLKNDVDWSNVMALERFTETGDKTGKRVQAFEKTDIFQKRVVEKEKEPKPQNVKDGIIASVYQYGRINPDYIAAELGKSVDEVKAEITESGLGFEDPVTMQMEVSYEYLSGNVREKLAQAEEANKQEGMQGKYDANIEALKKVIPMDIPAHLIEFTIGSSWIEPQLYEQFIKEKTGLDVKLVNVGGTWEMTSVPYYVNTQQNRAMGVHSDLLNKHVYGHELIKAALTNKTIQVSKVEKKWDGSTETIRDKDATAACASKVDEIRAEFRDWARQKMQSDAEMSAKMEKEYNERFNNYVPLDVSMDFVPEYFAGANHVFQMRPHQAKAIIRGTMQPLMLAHEVGTGKTFTLISTAMEMRRLGTAKKPMVVVQNATVGQFVASAKTLYPNAKVLTLDDKDHTLAGRKSFYAKIKYNDWDMIVVPQSVFERIPDSEERQMAFIQDKIAEKMEILEQMKEDKDNSMIARQAQSEIDKLNEELNSLAAVASDKRKKRDEKKEAVTRQNTEVKAKEMLDRAVDDVENFDDMGIDALLVDEAHEYKHLGFATAMQRGVKGVDPSYSKKSQGVYLKTQAVLEKNNGRNVIFATGTPISNTAAEVWTFMKYLMPADVMKEYNIYYFDDFVRNFGNIVQMMEFTTSGKFKENNRFAGYINLPELARIWASVADTVRTEDAQAVKDNVPQMEGGKAQDIYLPQTKALRSIMKFVKARLDEYDKMSGKEKKENSHIPLTMYGIAKAAAVDPRLVQDDAEDDPNSKTNEAVRQTLKSLEDSKAYKGTVALFADNYQNKTSGFNLYEDIRQKLIEQGVPADQIAIIKGGMTDKKKQEIFDKVNSGEIRVIMGSTFTLGTGVNIQERLHTLIHIDAPNRPMDYTQRNGRIVRQGNLHKEWDIPVRVLRFGVEDSLDVTAYQRLKTKGAIADSMMNSKAMLSNSMEDRTMEEDEDVFGDITAQLSGSQYAMLKNQAEREVRKYESKKKQYEADQAYVHFIIPRYEQRIADEQASIEQDTATLEKLDELFGGATPKITVNGKTFATVEDMADFFTEQNKKTKETEDALRKVPGEEQRTRSIDIQIGDATFTFKTTQKKTMEEVGIQLVTHVSRSITYSCPELDIENYRVDGGYLKGGVEDILKYVVSGRRVRADLQESKNDVERLTSELALAKERQGKPFQYTEELETAKEKLDEYTELMRKELEEKEAKYAEMDKDVRAAENITDAEEDSDTPDSEKNVNGGENVRDSKKRGVSLQLSLSHNKPKDGKLADEHKEFAEKFDEINKRIKSATGEERDRLVDEKMALIKAKAESMGISEAVVYSSLWKAMFEEAKAGHIKNAILLGATKFSEMRSPGTVKGLFISGGNKIYALADTYKTAASCIGALVHEDMHYSIDALKNTKYLNMLRDMAIQDPMLYDAMLNAVVAMGGVREHYGDLTPKVLADEFLSHGAQAMELGYSAYEYAQDSQLAKIVQENYEQRKQERLSGRERQLRDNSIERTGTSYSGDGGRNTGDGAAQERASWSKWRRALGDLWTNVGIKTSEGASAPDGGVRAPMVERFEDGQVLPVETNWTDEGRLSVEGLAGTFDNMDDLLDAFRNKYDNYVVNVTEDGENIEVTSWRSVLKGAPKSAASREKHVERKTRNALAAVDSLAKKLGLNNIDVKTDTEGLTGKQKTSKGWFDPRTGKIVIVLPNHSSQQDVMRTLLHEAVAHYGLRKLFGKDFDTFLDNVFQNASGDVRRKIVDMAAKKYDWNFRTATEEYLASLAEDTNFERAMRSSWWGKIKQLFLNMLAKKGIKLGVTLTDNELRYILWRSYDNLENPGYHVLKNAEDIVMQQKLGVGNYSQPNSADGTQDAEGSEAHLREEDVEAINDRFNEDIDNFESLPQGYRFELGMPSDKLLAAGFESLPIMMRASLVGKKKGDPAHSFEADDLKNLVLAMQNPIAVFNYTKDNMRNVIVDITKGDKHFLVGITLNFKGKNSEFEINSVSGLFPKDSHEWIKWIQDGKAVAIYEKQKVQDLIDSLRINPAEANRIGLNLDDVAKLVNNFENPNISEEKVSENDGLLYRDGDDDTDLKDRPLSLQESILQGLMTLAEKNKENMQFKIDIVRSIGGKLSKLRKAMSAQRDYDRSTVNDIVGLARLMMKNNYLGDLTDREVRKLMKIIQNATGKEDITNAARELVEMLVDNQVRQAMQLIAQVTSIKGSKVNAQGVEVQGKLDPVGQALVKAFRNAMKMNAEQIEERMAEVSDRMDSEDQTIADNAVTEYAALNLALTYSQDIIGSKAEESSLHQQISDASEDYKAGRMSKEAYKEFVKSTKEAILQNKIERIEATRELVAKFAGLLRGSIESAEAFRKREKERVEQIHHYANSDMQGKPTDEHHQENWKQKVMNNSFIRFFLKPLATFDQMLRMFGNKSVNGEGYLYNHYMRGWLAANDREFNKFHEACKILDEKVSEVFGKKMRWSDLYSVEKRMPKVTVSFWDGGEMKDHELTQGNLMYIYMVNKMTDGQMKLRRMGITDSDMEHITELIDSRFIQLADWLQNEFLVKKRNEYNEVHVRMFGAPMAAIDNYFPLKILANARMENVDIADVTNDKSLPSTTTGSIIKRRRNALALDITGADAFSVVVEHIQQMEKWAAFAEFNRDVNTLLSYKRFRNRVMNMSSIYGGGKTLWNNFKDCARIAAGTYHPTVGNDSVDKTLVNVAKGVTAAKIAFRVYTALKQLLSFPAFFAEANPARIAASVATPWKSWNWAMKELPTFAKRWQSKQAGDSRLLQTDMDWRFWQNRIVEKLSRWGMSPNAFVDAMTVAIGARAIYKTKLANYRKMGYTEEEAQKRAKQDAAILVNESQQSNENAFLSTMQLDRSVASVSLSVFRNSSMGYQRQLVDSLRNLARMLKPGYHEQSIAFMTKQMVRDGLSEAQAERAAKRTYMRAVFRNLARVAIFGYVMQFAWNLGPYLFYLIGGDDDDDKEEMLKDAAVHALFGGLEGLSGGNILSEVLNMKASGKSLRNYDFNLLPLMSDVQSIIKNLESDKVAAANDIVNLLAQSAVGVNPQTLTDAAVAIYDACDGDAKTSREVTILIARLLSVPQSQIEKVYIDELGMTGEEASKLTVAEMAERYAKYKRMKGAALTQWAYSDDEEKAVEDKYIKKFESKVKDKITSTGDKALDEAYESYGESSKEVRKALESINRYKITNPTSYEEKMKELESTPEYSIYDTYNQYKRDIDELIKLAMQASTSDEKERYLNQTTNLKRRLVEKLDKKTQELNDMKREMVGKIRDYDDALKK